MKTNFDWDKFKTEDIAIHLRTIEEYNDFIERAKEEGHIRAIEHDTFAEEVLVNLPDLYVSFSSCFGYKTLTYGTLEEYLYDDYKIIEWGNYMKD